MNESKVMESYEAKPELNNTKAWAAISRFLDRPWWKRVWTLQEVVAQQTTSIVCGLYYMTWHQIMIAVLSWQNLCELDLSLSERMIVLIRSQNWYLIKRCDYWKHIRDAVTTDLVELVDERRGV